MNYRNKCGYRGISAFLILLMLFIPQEQNARKTTQKNTISAILFPNITFFIYLTSPINMMQSVFHRAPRMRGALIWGYLIDVPSRQRTVPCAT